MSAPSTSAPLSDLVASFRVLIADLSSLQPPESLCEFELAAVGERAGRRFVRSDRGRQRLSALGAQLAARNADLIRQTQLLN